jgi:hypothetical protein
MFLQASTTAPVAKAASTSVGDPGSTRLVYLIVVVLVLLGVGLGFFAFTFWKRTRPGASAPRRHEAEAWHDPRPQSRPETRREPQAVPTRSTRPTGSANRQWWDDGTDDDGWQVPEPQAPQQRPAQQRPAQPRPAQQRPVQPRPGQQRPPAPRDPLL